MGKAARRKRNRNAVPIDLEPHPDKVSTRIAELIEPHHLASEETRDSYTALVALGVMAWNLSLFSPAQRIDMIRKTVQGAADIGLPLTDEWLGKLIDRKIFLFPSDDRFIDHFDVREEPDGRFTIRVYSLSEG